MTSSRPAFPSLAAGVALFAVIAVLAAYGTQLWVGAAGVDATHPAFAGGDGAGTGVLGLLTPAFVLLAIAAGVHELRSRWEGPRTQR